MTRMRGPGTGGITRKIRSCALAALLLWGCAPHDAKRPEAPDRMRVVVEFQVPENAGKDAPRETAARILSRLKPDIRKTARTFELLPLIAVDADAKTLLRLIRMPEIESIRPDREVAPLGASGMSAPITPPGITTR